MRVMKWCIGFLSLVLMAACARFPFFWRQEQPSTRATGASSREGVAEGAKEGSRTMLELRDISYDGQVVTGRLLISVLEGSIRLDRRLFPNVDVHMGSVLECGTGRPIPFMEMDVMTPRAREGDLLILEHGYWYGTTVSFNLFSEQFTGLGPECVEAELWLLSFDGKLIASTPVRASRTIPQPGDGGTSEEPRHTEDPNAPSSGPGSPGER